MDKYILKKWLAAGYMEEGILYPTQAGTPQGGIASATMANMTLDGLEQAAKQAAQKNQKVNVVKYADDFIITGACREVLVDKIIPTVAAFLKERGLELSKEKTKVTHIENGFDFLGFNIRKYSGTLLIKPAKQSIKTFLAKIRACIRTNRTVTTEQLIRQLNPMIRGWAYYYRHAVAKRTFSYVDHQVFLALLAWINRRHPNKSAKWKRKRYFRNRGLNNGIFFTSVRDKKGKVTNLDLFRASDVAIIRHVKIRADATPYDPAYREYFEKRASSRNINPFVWSGSVAETPLDDQKKRKTGKPGQATGLREA
jgi:RNA-directed DNA polymerase